MTFGALFRDVKFSAINTRARLEKSIRRDINYVANANHEYSASRDGNIRPQSFWVTSHWHSSFLSRETRQIPRILERVVLDPAFVWRLPLEKTENPRLLLKILSFTIRLLSQLFQSCLPAKSNACTRSRYFGFVKG